VASFLVELTYVLFVSFGLPALLRERARAMGLEFHHQRIVGFVPGRVHIDGLRIETNHGARVSLRWEKADCRLRLLELLRGKLVVARFSGHGLDMRAAPTDAPRATAERRARTESRPALAATSATSTMGIAPAVLTIERLESHVERLELGGYRTEGGVRLRADSVVIGGSAFRAHRLVFELESARVFRKAARVTKQLTGRAAIAVVRLGRASPGGDWEPLEVRGKLALRAVQPSLAAFPPFDRLSLGEGAVAVAELAIDPTGVSGTARLTSPGGALWDRLAAEQLLLSETVTLTATRRNAAEPVRVELSVPVLDSDCRSTAFCVEAIEGLRIATEARLNGEPRKSDARNVEISSRAARVRVAGRTFETRAMTGSMALTRSDGGASLRIDRGTLHLREIDWLSSDGPRQLAVSASLNLDDGLLSQRVGQVRGDLHAYGSDAGALVALAPMPWLKTVFAGVVGKPYSFEGSVRFAPGRFELEHARLSAARLLVRGAHRSYDGERSGAFLFQYASWSIGAVFDESGVRTRFGVGERWLQRQSSAASH
jgi:hypothetical protein